MSIQTQRKTKETITFLVHYAKKYTVISHNTYTINILNLTGYDSLFILGKINMQDIALLKTLVRSRD